MDKQHILRKNLRLKDYDYTRYGSYFVTICTFKRKQILWDFRSGDPCGRLKPTYTELGKIALGAIADLTDGGEIEISNYAVMPNHVHLLINFVNPCSDSREGCHYNLSQIVSKYKSLVSNRWLAVCKDKNIYMGKIWQRSFYDHIIRGKRDYNEIWQYIENNPVKWEADKYYY